MLHLLGSHDALLLVCDALVCHPQDAYTLALTCRDVDSATRILRQHFIRRGIRQLSAAMVGTKRWKRVVHRRLLVARSAIRRLRADLPHVELLHLRAAYELCQAETTIWRQLGSYHLAHHYRSLPLSEAEQAIHALTATIAAARVTLPPGMLARRAHALDAYIAVASASEQIDRQAATHQATLQGLQVSVQRANSDIIRLSSHRESCRDCLNALVLLGS